MTHNYIPWTDEPQSRMWLYKTNSSYECSGAKSNLYSSHNEGEWDISISGFVLEEQDSVQIHHEIIFCLESDSIVVSFSSSTGFLRLNIHQFWSQHITCYFLSSCIHGYCCFYRQHTSEKWRVRKLGSLRKSTKRTCFPHLRFPCQ